MKKLSEKAVRLVAKSLKALISAYQATKFLRQPTCRFYPSCSHYAYQAIDSHGAVNGVLLSIVRLVKCHPFHSGGVDEVPSSVDFDFKRFDPKRFDPKRFDPKRFDWNGAGPIAGKLKRMTREL